MRITKIHGILWYAIINLDIHKGKYLLKTGLELTKDPSYFLYRLKQEQLHNILLPIGGFSKAQIRDYARTKGLNVADKPDSQDFYEGDYNDLLQIEDKIGNIVDKDGKILGQHNGFWNYTVGQRKGIGVSSSKPLYVLELKKDTNEVVVGFKNSTMKNKLVANNLNRIEIDEISKEFECEAKIRSSQFPQKVFVKLISKDKIEVEFENMQNTIALGQSVVLCKNDVVLGGGIIDGVN